MVGWQAGSGGYRDENVFSKLLSVVAGVGRNKIVLIAVMPDRKYAVRYQTIQFGHTLVNICN